MKRQKGRAVSFTESLPSVVEKLIAAVNGVVTRMTIRA
jgi:hypothetical protein